MTEQDELRQQLNDCAREVILLSKGKTELIIDLDKLSDFINQHTAEVEAGAELQGQIKTLKHIVGSDVWYMPHKGVPIRINERIAQLSPKKGKHE